MSRFLIETPHTKEECLRSLDELLAKGPDTLRKFDWACSTGKHAGYAIIDADNESAVRNLLPSFLRDKARITQVSKFTPEQIKSFHKAA